MAEEPLQIPGDVETLTSLVTAQAKTINRLHRQIAELTAQNPAKQGELQAIIDELHGELAQLSDGDGRKPGNGGSQRRRSRRRRGDRTPQRGHGPTPQPELEVVTERHEIPEDERICTGCGGALTPTGQAETSKLVDVIEVNYLVRKVERERYQCTCSSCDTNVVIAPGPEDRLIDGGRYTVGFGVGVAVDKHVSNLPLNKIKTRMGRAGLKVTTATLFDQTDYLAQLAEPTYDALRRKILEEDVIGLDQTSWRLLKKGAKTHQVWALTSLDSVWLTIEKAKDTATCHRVLGDFPGTIVADAMSTHDAWVKEVVASGRPPPQLAGCWSHVRTRFYKCESDFPDVATPILDDIDMLFELERTHRRRADESEDEYHRRLLAVRNGESRTVVGRIRQHLVAFRPPPGGTKLEITRAVGYALRYWPRLILFLDDPAIWLDNNRTERALRTPVLGRKISLGSKSSRGMQVASVLYSLTQTALLQSVDPAAYLTEVAMRAKRQPGTITMPVDLR